MKKPHLNNYTIELVKSNRNAWIETPSCLLELGMCLCDTCGELSSFEDGECLACGETIVIFKKK